MGTPSVNARAPVRRAARALIVDAEQRVLLFRGDLPGRDPWWFAPGGALEPGETYEAALVREVMEETALVIHPAELGPPVWTRDSIFTWLDVPERHVEQFFLVRVVNHNVDIGGSDGSETGVIRTFRWWGVDDILGSNQRFAPQCLGAQLAALLQQGAPDQPVAIRE